MLLLLSALSVLDFTHQNHEEANIVYVHRFVLFTVCYDDKQIYLQVASLMYKSSIENMSVFIIDFVQVVIILVLRSSIVYLFMMVYTNVQRSKVSLKT